MLRFARSSSFCFFLNDTATTEIYTLSLHDALPICTARTPEPDSWLTAGREIVATARNDVRSEEHTFELQSRLHLACRLLPAKTPFRWSVPRHGSGWRALMLWGAATPI